MNGRTTELRVLRAGLGISQTSLAEACGLDRSRLSRIETGLIQPTTEELRSILGVLGPEGPNGLLAARAFLGWLKALRATCRNAQHRESPDDFQG